jgi:hypothetical protein
MAKQKMAKQEDPKISKKEMTAIAAWLSVNDMGNYPLNSGHILEHIIPRTHLHDGNQIEEIRRNAEKEVLSDPETQINIQKRMITVTEDFLQKSLNVPIIRSINPEEIKLEPGRKVSLKPGEKNGNYVCGYDTNEIPEGTKGEVLSRDGPEYVNVQVGLRRLSFNNSEVTGFGLEKVIAERKKTNGRLGTKGPIPKEEFNEMIFTAGVKAIKKIKEEKEKRMAKIEKNKFSFMADYLTKRTKDEDLKKILSQVKGPKSFDHALKRTVSSYNRKMKSRFYQSIADFISTASLTTPLSRKVKGDLMKIAKTEVSKTPNKQDIGFDEFRKYFRNLSGKFTQDERWAIPNKLSESLYGRIRTTLIDFGIGYENIRKIFNGRTTLRGILGRNEVDAEGHFRSTIGDGRRDIKGRGLMDLQSHYDGLGNEAKLKNFLGDLEGSVMEGYIQGVGTSAVMEFFSEQLQGAGIFGNDRVVNSAKVKELKNQRLRSFQSDVKAFTERNGLDIGAVKQKKYVLIPDPTGQFKEGNLDPYKIGEEFLEDLLKTAKRKVSTNRGKGIIAIAEELIKKKNAVNQGDFKKVLNKPNKIWYNDSQGILGEDSLGKESSRRFRQFIPGASSIFVKDRNDIQGHRMLEQSGLYLLQRDLIVEEMIASISKGTKKGNGGIGDDFRIFWERYRPEQFDLDFMKSYLQPHKELPSHYSFKVAGRIGAFKNAVGAAGSCLRDASSRAFQNDSGTINLIGYDSEDMAKGYARFYLTEDDRREPSLAMDTIEFGRKDFEGHWDWMRAIGLATMQFGLDMGVKNIFGSDSRVKYGPRQAFGDVYKNETRLTKIGETDFPAWNGMRPYSFKFDKESGKYVGKTSILLRNWRQNNGKK